MSPPFEVQDETLSSLAGGTLSSTYQPAVSYRIHRTIGEGGTAITFLAVRGEGDRTTPVILKVVRPVAAGDDAAFAGLSVMKEAVALGRLNERTPPTPYVVRLIDSGAMDVVLHGTTCRLPWLAIEYVHGGVEGTTLAERIDFSVKKTD